MRLSLLALRRSGTAAFWGIHLRQSHLIGRGNGLTVLALTGDRRFARGQHAIEDAKYASCGVGGGLEAELDVAHCRPGPGP